MFQLSPLHHIYQALSASMMSVFDIEKLYSTKLLGVLVWKFWLFQRLLWAMSDLILDAILLLGKARA